MKNILALIGWFILIAALIVYLYGIYVVVFSPPKNNVLSPPLDMILSIVGATLLTNFGAVLGISVVRQNALLTGNKAFAFLIPDPTSQRQLVQYVGVSVYLIILVACFIDWIIRSQQLDSQGHAVAILPIIVVYGKTFIGVVAGYLAVVFGVK